MDLNEAIKEYEAKAKEGFLKLLIYRNNNKRVNIKGNDVRVDLDLLGLLVISLLELKSMGVDSVKGQKIENLLSDLKTQTIRFKEKLKILTTFTEKIQYTSPFELIKSGISTKLRIASEKESNLYKVIKTILDAEVEVIMVKSTFKGIQVGKGPKWN